MLTSCLARYAVGLLDSKDMFKNITPVVHRPSALPRDLLTQSRTL